MFPCKTQARLTVALYTSQWSLEKQIQESERQSELEHTATNNKATTPVKSTVACWTDPQLTLSSWKKAQQAGRSVLHNTQFHRQWYITFNKGLGFLCTLNS